MVLILRILQGFKFWVLLLLEVFKREVVKLWTMF